MKPLYLLAAFASAAVAAIGLVLHMGSDATAAPNSAFVLIDGSTRTSAELKGRVTLVNFWATSCTSCVAEMPQLIATYDKYHGKGFEILGISLDDNREAFDKITSSKKMTWRHHFDGKGWKNEIAQLYGVNSIPATYLIGPDGKIAAVGLRGDALEKHLSKLLTKK